MKTSSRSLLPLGTLLVGAVLGGAASSTIAPVIAQAPASMGIGVVDEDKLADGYKKYSTAVENVDKMSQSLDAKIPAREFLGEVDGKSFDALIMKTSLSATEKPQMDRLVKVGLDARAEYMGLVGKAVRTPEETARMNVLQQSMTRNGAALQELAQKLVAKIRTEQEKVDKTYTDNANSVVGQVASDKKLVLIVRKKALLWASDAVDITNDVLARLNRA